MMHGDKGNLFTRDDTFLGVCEGLGEDLRIPSNLFRLAFALVLFFSPQGAVIGYFALGALVLLSRLVFPAPRVPRPVAETAEVPPQISMTAGKVPADEQMDLDLLPIAA